MKIILRIYSIHIHESLVFSKTPGCGKLLILSGFL